MIMKPAYFKGIFKKSQLIFDSVENPFEDYYIVKFIPKGKLIWKAGEHGIFSFGGYRIKGKNSRVFSIASIPDEGFLTIGTRTGEKASGFKKRLIGLKKGDEVNLRGPLGWFLLRNDFSPLLMVAGGVGITPIRALLKEIEKDNKRKVEVVYSSGTGFLFEDEIRQMAERNSQISLAFAKDRQETGKMVGEIAAKLRNGAYYYISGSPKMAKSVSKRIAGEGVSRGRIIYDPFYGYSK